MVFFVTQFLTHLFDKILEKSKNSEKQRKSKKYVFNIFASFLAFSALSQKNLIFQSSFESVQLFTLHLKKSLIFLIESMLILLV
jgi:hypothetical protein